jgi:hypothetical protein
MVLKVWINGCEWQAPIRFSENEGSLSLIGKNRDASAPVNRQLHPALERDSSK